MTRSIDIADLRYAELLAAGDVVAWSQAVGEPVALTQALVAQRESLVDAGIFIGMTSSGTLRPEHAASLRMTGLNGAGTNRRLTAAGVLDVVPVHVSTVPALLRSKALRVDVALIQVRLHEPSGMYSLGVVADYTRALMQSARLVIAQLNDDLPRTGHEALVPAEEIDLFVHAPGQVLEMPDPEPRSEDIAVAKVVAGVIPDGATLQLGIGALPVAVVRALEGHRDLGIHSGVIFDAIADFMEKGVITNARKGCDAGATVTGGLFGTRRLYRFADLNDAVHLRSVEHTHNPAVMARVERLHTINSAIEVDVTGQINAEVAGGAYLGAVGGQVDFVRGAACSPGGRSIIALSAATPDGRRSRIVPGIQRGPVTTPRCDVDLIVTEFGVADLRGQALAERARRLIAIAHPDFREDLERAIRDPASGVAAASGLSPRLFGTGRTPEPTQETYT
jgi:acyl-CoA hydrolase